MTSVSDAWTASVVAGLPSRDRTPPAPPAAPRPAPKKGGRDEAPPPRSAAEYESAARARHSIRSDSGRPDPASVPLSLMTSPATASPPWQE